MFYEVPMVWNLPLVDQNKSIGTIFSTIHINVSTFHRLYVFRTIGQKTKNLKTFMNGLFVKREYRLKRFIDHTIEIILLSTISGV